MSKKISELTAAGALTGTEQVEIVQSVASRRTTTQDIADLAGSGISNSAANNELMKSNGTDAIASGIFSTAAGNIDLGTGVSGSTRTIVADGSGSNIGVTVRSKGTGSAVLSSSDGNQVVAVSSSTQIASIASTGIVQLQSTSDLIRILINPSSTNTVERVANFRRNTSGTPATGIGASIGLEVETATDNFEVGAIIEAVTTDATATTEDFDVLMKTMVAGAAAATRLKINGSAITIPNTVSELGAVEANTISIYSVDDSAETTLGIRTEKAVASDAGVASTHSLRIKINGTIYKLLLATP